MSREVYNFKLKGWPVFVIFGVFCYGLGSLIGDALEIAGLM